MASLHIARKMLLFKLSSSCTASESDETGFSIHACCMTDCMSSSFGLITLYAMRHGCQALQQSYNGDEAKTEHPFLCFCSSAVRTSNGVTTAVA